MILEELLAHPGPLVTRAQLIARLWPNGVIDFDTALNSAVRRLRVALGAHAETPRYIETVPRRRYRFIGTLDAPVAGQTSTLAQANLDAASLQELPAPSAVQPPVDRPEARSPPLRKRPHAYVAIALGAAMLLVVMVAIFGLRREPVPVTERYESADRAGERLRVDVQLVDAQSDQQLWSTAFDRPLKEIAAIREKIFQHVADVLRIPVEPATSNDSGSTRINLDAYQLNTRGQQLLASSTATDAEKAIELFRRATILDSSFART